MSSLLRFDGRVAIVTGAGRGLGRAYALLLASRGATVVVNDIGCPTNGDRGQYSSKDVDDVVMEIQRKGGKAMGNYDSVLEGRSIAEAALKKYGRIDILINNAGILRDRKFEKLTNEDWDQVEQVHLKGAFTCTKAVWPHMMQQKYGRIVMTTSASGLLGNYGQTNYAAAKSGLVGFAQALSKEGLKHGILVSTIAPMAASRMTENILPPDLFKQLKPELIAPVVAYMCHESFSDNAAIIESAGGIAAKYQWLRSPGTFLRKSLDEGVTMEVVQANWNNICSLDPRKHDLPKSAFDSASRIMEGLEAIENGVGTIAEEDVTKENLTEYKIPNTFYEYVAKDAMLYALSVGMSLKEKEGLNYLYENSEDFRVLPSFPVLAATDAMFNVLKLPGLNIDLARVLHGEQYVELHRPLPEKSDITVVTKVVDVLDKISGAAYIMRMEGEDADGPLFTTEFLIFEAGAGGYGGKRDTDKPITRTVATPTRKSDHAFEFKTTQDQAALYRLSGDFNPLHIDPEFSSLGGFKQPILHGLCSFGITTRILLHHFANADPRQFKSIKVRFSKPVYPGQTLIIETWKENKRIHFEVKVKETGDKVLSGGYMDLSTSVALQEQMESKSKL